jgi:hypothetical protein
MKHLDFQQWNTYWYGSEFIICRDQRKIFLKSDFCCILSGTEITNLKYVVLSKLMYFFKFILLGLYSSSYSKIVVAFLE